MRCAAPRCKNDAVVIRGGNSLCEDDKDRWFQVSMELYEIVTVDDMSALAEKAKHLYAPFIQMGAEMAQDLNLGPEGGPQLPPRAPRPSETEPPPDTGPD